MIEPTFTAVRLRRHDRIATVTIDHPPINLLDATLMSELRRALTMLRGDPDVRAIVFDSADPEFFLSHVDMTLGEQPAALADLMRDVPDGLNPFQAFAEVLRSQPQVTIVKLAGIARGGGAEFVAAADMAFGAIGHAALGQCETLMGIVPGGGGTQYLGERMTRARALEVVLGADLFDAESAECYGWINRALPAGELDGFVARLAANIASLSDEVVAAAKQAIAFGDMTGGFARETAAWSNLVSRPKVGLLMARQLAAGAQTRDGERDLEQLLRNAGA